MVTILIVSYNAPRYLWRALRSIKARTRGVVYEIVVVDNDSRWPTRTIVAVAGLFKMANRVALLDRNTLFAEGCNIAASMSARKSEYVLLLNSDTAVMRDDWLANLLSRHERGATAYGLVRGGPVPRADGYCLLVDRDLFLEYGLDEGFQWWWSATRLQAVLLNEGYSVQAVEDHDEWLIHYGGKSGKAWKGAKGMETSPEEVRAWFQGKGVVAL